MSGGRRLDLHNMLPILYFGPQPGYPPPASNVAAACCHLLYTYSSGGTLWTRAPLSLLHTVCVRGGGGATEQTSCRATRSLRNHPHRCHHIYMHGGTNSAHAPIPAKIYPSKSRDCFNMWWYHSPPGCCFCTTSPLFQLLLYYRRHHTPHNKYTQTTTQHTCRSELVTPRPNNLSICCLVEQTRLGRFSTRLTQHWKR